MNATTLPHRPDIARPELGSLLSMLFLMIDELRSVVVHVTSASPGEGATTVARDIAASAARRRLVQGRPGRRAPRRAPSARRGPPPAQD